MNASSLIRLFAAPPEVGMKFDARIMRRASFRAGWQAVMLLGVTGLFPAGTWADEITGLSDPTRPAFSLGATAGSASAKPMGPVLQSTFISANQRRAVISGKSYTLGDKFGGGTISEIQSYEVVLKKADRETHLRLLPKLVKETYMVKVPANSQEGGKK